MIEVTQTGHGDPLEFEIVISDEDGATRHLVTMNGSDLQRLTGSEAAPEQCVRAAIRFLLDREPKEAILAHFDIMVIARYFPEFEARLPDYLDAAN